MGKRKCQILALTANYEKTLAQPSLEGGEGIFIACCYAMKSLVAEA